MATNTKINTRVLAHRYDRVLEYSVRSSRYRGAQPSLYQTFNFKIDDRRVFQLSPNNSNMGYIEIKLDAKSLFLLLLKMRSGKWERSQFDSSLHSWRKLPCGGHNLLSAMHKLHLTLLSSAVRLKCFQTVDFACGIFLLFSCYDLDCGF